MTALSHIHSFATITLSLAISFITTSIWNLYPMSVFPYLHCPDILSHPSLAPHFCISLSKVIFILLWPWAATASVWFYSKIQILDELEIKQNKQNKKNEQQRNSLIKQNQSNKPNITSALVYFPWRLSDISVFFSFFSIFSFQFSFCELQYFI